VAIAAVNMGTANITSGASLTLLEAGACTITIILPLLVISRAFSVAERLPVVAGFSSETRVAVYDVFAEKDLGWHVSTRRSAVARSPSLGLLSERLLAILGGRVHD
jgi:hypothetical protein